MSSNPGTKEAPHDLAKMTISQMKTLCKELKISGYSKLGKAALLEKLQQHFHVSKPGDLSTCNEGINSRQKNAQNSGNFSFVASHSSLIGTVYEEGAKASLCVATCDEEQQQNLQSNQTGDKETHNTSDISEGSYSEPTSIDIRNHPSHADDRDLTFSSTSVGLNTSVSPFSGQGKASLKRKAESSDAQKKKTKIAASSGKASLAKIIPLLDKSNTEILPLTTSSENNLLIIVEASRVTNSPPVISAARNKNVKNEENRHISRGFVPLIGNRPPISAPVPQEEESDIHSDDVESADSLTLSSIKFPLSLSQRKFVYAWAVILSGLSDAERHNCAQVSKILRYAVYLSATNILKQHFNGIRLSEMHKKYPIAMTNYWPYLRARLAETQANEKEYLRSFLRGVCDGRSLIVSRLQSNPDHPKQFSVASRFAMTRFWFAISILGKSQFLCEAIITDASEVLKGEIWKIVTSRRVNNTSIKKEFYVLESTCEVIGQPNIVVPKDPIIATSSGLPIRVDWSSYIQKRIRAASDLSTSQPLLSILKWTNMEEYDKGISRHWLKRLQKEGKNGLLKRVVAERYVLASVVGNSISGRWMTSTHMSQIFSGNSRSDDEVIHNRSKPCQVNLFLPSHHLVESVHFFSRAGFDLHHAIAVVQTPGREYFVLRENGMEIGCEEDGVWTKWMHVLKCDSHGLPATQGLEH